MKEFWKKYKISITIALYLLFLAAVLFFVVRPLAERINQQADKSQETLVIQENSKKRLEELPKLEGQYEMVKKEESRMLTLVTGDRVVELIEKMEKLAEDTGNEISISVKDSEKDEKNAKKSEQEEEEASLISELPSSDFLELGISLTGNFNTIVNFIKKVESMEYYADIISLDVSSKSTLDSTKNRQVSTGMLKSSDSQSTQGDEDTVAENTVEAVINLVFYQDK